MKFYLYIFNAFDVFKELTLCSLFLFLLQERD
jgi:hypothetical protein